MGDKASGIQIVATEFAWISLCCGEFITGERSLRSNSVPNSKKLVSKPSEFIKSIVPCVRFGGGGGGGDGGVGGGGGWWL